MPQDGPRANSLPFAVILDDPPPDWCLFYMQNRAQMEDGMSKVSVIGLGPMGAALARLLVAAGGQVTVWNATPRLDAVPGASVA